MKRFIIFVSAAIILCGIYSFKKAHSVYNNIFTRLGLQTEEAEGYITANLIGGSTTFPSSGVIAKLALNKRAEAIKEIGDYLKAYVKKPGFATEYANTRLELKPESPSTLHQGIGVMETYKQDLKSWEADYPPTVNGLLKKKLKEFLQLTSDINFNAELKKQGDRVVFADPALEEKDEFWKACFRSGKPTVNAARSYAQQWLQELN